MLHSSQRAFVLIKVKNHGRDKLRYGLCLRVFPVFAVAKVALLQAELIRQDVIGLMVLPCWLNQKFNT